MESDLPSDEDAAMLPGSVPAMATLMLIPFVAEAQAEEPNDVAGFVERGDALQAMAKFDEASADYTRAIKLDPNRAAAYHGRGLCRHQKGDYDGAIADFSDAIRLNPKSDRDYYNR